MSKALAAELVMRCFNARTSSHIAHLQTKSYAEHMALNAFYDDVIDATDEFAECYQGVFGVIDKYPELPCEHGALKPIYSLRKWLAEHRSAVAAGQRELENLIDEISAVCDRAIYKLVNLK
jgi:hypothetical protein